MTTMVLVKANPATSSSGEALSCVVRTSSGRDGPGTIEETVVPSGQEHVFYVFEGQSIEVREEVVR